MGLLYKQKKKYADDDNWLTPLPQEQPSEPWLNPPEGGWGGRPHLAGSSGGYQVAPAQTQRIGRATIEYPEVRYSPLSSSAPESSEGSGIEYFQPPEYIGPEDIQGVPSLMTGQGSSSGQMQPQFYSLTEGDYDELEKLLYEGAMEPVREDLAARGMLDSTMYAQAAADQASAARMQRMQLQSSEQTRRTQWEQSEALRQWQQQEQQYRTRLMGYQVAQSEAQQRRQWLWNAYSMQHQDYWNQIGTMLQSILMPYQAVPYQGVQYGVPTW